MNSYQITNPNNLNYINNKVNNNILSPKRKSQSPLIYHNNKINYGEKIQEKNNYILYVSGSGYQRPQYEQRQKKIKIINNVYDYDYDNQININKNINYNIYEEEDNNNILSSSDNYKYKETKNIKVNNPNLKVVTIHKRLGSPRHSQINIPKKNKKLKIKKVENTFSQKEYNPSRKININDNEQIKILRENKSARYLEPINKRNYFENFSFNPQNNGEIIQEIIQNDDNNEYNYNNYNNYNNNRIINEDSQIETAKNGDYFIKVTTKRKEVEPNNYNNQNENENYDYINKNGKIIKVIRNNGYLCNNEENCDIYQKNNLNRNRDENEPYYIGNYGEGEEENYESSVKYNNNYRFRDIEEYEQDEYLNQKYMNRENKYGYNNYNQENEYVDDIRDIKSIECPLHGKISIIIHKNPFDKN